MQSGVRVENQAFLFLLLLYLALMILLPPCQEVAVYLAEEGEVERFKEQK